MRVLWLVGSLAFALLIAAVSLRSPEALGIGESRQDFAADRAMGDIREIARRPHPVGSVDHTRVQTYLLQRMAALGLETSVQTGPISDGAARYLRDLGGDPEAANFTASNLVGVLPGRRPELPAVALMAHYDTVPNSAGAADDSTGVATILETVRAIRARGPADRTLVVLFTDAEEIGLEGARVFWGGHPLRDRIGAVINLEARGGGGRAMMFETGRGNAQTIDRFAEATHRVHGGVTSNSLAVLVYERMPNGTDFTIPKDRGVQGLNLAFIGRPEQYHAPASKPPALDRGAVQHIGSQALENADALLRAPALPKSERNVVYADLFGQVVVSHPPVAGWGVFGLAAALLSAAVWRARSRAGLTWVDLGRGGVDGLWFLSTALVLTQAVRTLAGPMAARAESAGAYYTLLARLPWMEAGAALAVLAAALALLGGRARVDRRVLTGTVAAAALIALGLGGFNPLIIGAAVVAVALSLAPGLAAHSTWGGWSGLILLVLVVGGLIQAVAPEAAFLFLWPALLAAAVAAVVAFVDPGLTRPAAMVPIALAVALGGGWLMGLSHPTFLGVGMDLPGVLALMGLLILMLLRPLSAETAWARPMLIAAAVVLVVGAGVAAIGQAARPMPSAETPA